jgi:hypothetical protein
MKNYLRVDFDDDDALFESLISASENLCMDIARIDSTSDFEQLENAKVTNYKKSREN